MPDIHDLTIPIALAKATIKGQLQSMRAELKAELDKQTRDTQAAERLQTISSKSAAQTRTLDNRTASQAAVKAAKDAGSAAIQAIRETGQASAASARERAEQARRLAADQIFWAKESADEAAKAEVVANDKRMAKFKKTSAIIQAMRDAETKGFFRQVTSVEALGGAFMKLQVVTQVAGVIRTAMHSVADSVNTARERIKAMVGEMESARTESKELAALLGGKPTAGFTANQAFEAAGAGLDVGAYSEFQKSFQAYTGQYVGSEEATPEELEKNHQKINGEQARRLQAKVATYAMGARGLGADDSARLLGTIIAKSKAGASDDDIMGQYAKLMKVMELAPGKTSPMLSQLAELGMESAGEGGDFKDLMQSGYLLRTMAQRNPAEASTYGRGLLRGLRGIRMTAGKKDDQMKALGITKDMDVFQQLDQIDKAAAANKAAGGDEGEFLSRYFQDVREWGAARVALNEGLRQGGFARSAAEASTVGAGTAAGQSREYLGGQEGVAAAGRSRLLGTNREQAGKYAPLRQLQMEALTQLVSSGDLEMPENAMNAILTGASSFQQGSREESETRALVGHNLRNRLGGYREGREYLQGHSFDRSTAEKDLADAARLLKRLADAAEKQNRGQDKPGPTLSAPPTLRDAIRQASL